MKKFLLLYALAVTLSLAGVLRRYRTETHRLEQNQRALLSQVERYRTRAGEAAASAEVLQLRCREFERLRAGDAERIRQLGIRLRRVEAAATLATATEIDVQVPLHDTIVRRDFAAVCDSGRLAAAVRFDTVRSFRWRDPWVTVEGRIRGDSADCRVEASCRMIPPITWYILLPFAFDFVSDIPARHNRADACFCARLFVSLM